MLTSTVIEDGRQFACERELVTFTCQVIRSASLQWRSPLIRQIGFTTDPADPMSVSRPPFVATLTNITGSGGNINFTSTLQVNALSSYARSDTTVECRNLLGVTEQSRFTVAGNNSRQIVSDTGHIHHLWYIYISFNEGIFPPNIECNLYNAVVFKIDKLLWQITQICIL